MKPNKNNSKIKSDCSWIKVVFPLLASAVLLVALAAFSMDVLSSLRAYASAQGLHSDARRDAVLKLSSYVKSHDEHEFQGFLLDIAVPLGDEQAHRALDLALPDLTMARQGFLAGHIHPDDIDGMIRLYSNFQHVRDMSAIIAIWSKADFHMRQLNAKAQQLHRAIASGHIDLATQHSAMASIEQDILQSNALGKEFASLLGLVARKVEYLLLLATIWIAALLVLGASLITVLILKRKKRSERALHISEERLSLAMSGTGDGLWDWDIAGASIFYSQRMKQILEEGSLQSLFAVDYFFKYVHPADQNALRLHLQKSLRDKFYNDIEFRIVTPSGKICWVRARAQLTLGADGAAVRMAGSITDISSHKQAAQELSRSKRALHMLSYCNDAVIRAETAPALLLQACRLAVDIGGYRMAWIGYADDNARRSITRMAEAGQLDDIDCARGLKLSWSAEDGAGQGPAGQAIRSGTAVIFENLVPARLTTCRGICLPLRDKKHVFGVLVLLCGDDAKISLQESTLLQDLADDLAFGIASLRAQEQQDKIQSAVLKIAAGVTASSGAEFLQHLTLNMTQALGADAGFVARFNGTEPLSASTLAAVVDGHAIDSFDYLLQGSSCMNLLTNDHYIISDNLVVTCALPEMLTQLATQAYVGQRLDDSLGRLIGFLVVMFKKPLQESAFINSTLKIFAARAAAEIERQSTDARIHAQASLLDKAQDAIIVRGIDRRIQYWNKSAERLYGWTREEVLGRSIDSVLLEHPADDIRAHQAVFETGEWHGEFQNRRKDGSLLMVESRWSLIRGDDGTAQSILAIDTDITLRKAAEQEVFQLAFYDQLTKLPNRRLLIDRLQQALVRNVRIQKAGALLFIDLDHFKNINDIVGREAGDLLLQQAAQRMVGSVRAVDTVARLGADEFVVMLHDLEVSNSGATAMHARAVGEKILAALSCSYRIAGLEHHSSASIGITLFGNVNEIGHEKSLETTGELLKRADLAMDQAKLDGRNTIRFFDPEMQAAITSRATLEADFRLALVRNEFLLHYQPQVGADTRVTGVEALVRWQHPQRGMVSPLEFIGLAEDTGLILPLGLWVLETACCQLAAWAAKASSAHLSIAVNVSARQFRHPDFVAQVIDVIERSGANPCRLKLELTESLMVNNMEAMIAKMTALKALGIGFALDDFGTGYSSLSYLKRLPLDQLKIDQSFVRDVLTDPNDAAIAHTIVALAQSLGLSVIAEGVETRAQRDFLSSKGCNAFQGYLFSRPLPIEQLETFMHHTDLGVTA